MNIEMIRAAAERLNGHARKTPILTSPFLDEIAGRRVLIKPECLQHTGSFKFPRRLVSRISFGRSHPRTWRDRVFLGQSCAGRCDGCCGTWGACGDYHAKRRA